MNCLSCGHAMALHLPAGCRLNGCRCEGYRSGDEEQPTNRRVTFEIPDGFMLSVSLVPYTAEAIASEPPDDEEAASG